LTLTLLASASPTTGEFDEKSGYPVGKKEPLPTVCAKAIENSMEVPQNSINRPSI
jgi:hypothetical protein